MRASVLPALELDPDENGRRRLDRLHALSSLAAICQLSGRTPDPTRPLRYERLSSNRALFNLSRLPVPCRLVTTGLVLSGEPPIRFTLERTGSARLQWNGFSPQHVSKEPRCQRFHCWRAPSTSKVFSPDSDIWSTWQTVPEGADEDEVGLNEDEEAAPDQAEHNGWLDFLT